MVSRAYQGLSGGFQRYFKVFRGKGVSEGLGAFKSNNGSSGGFKEVSEKFHIGVKGFSEEFLMVSERFKDDLQ